MLEVGHFSARVSDSDRHALIEPIAGHLASLPDGDDHVVTPRVSGAALLLVTGRVLLDTEFREHGGEVRTTGYRLDDPALVVALDSQSAQNGSRRRTVWHFRFRGGGQVEIAGETGGGATGDCDDAEAFARRLAARAAL